MLRFNMLYLHTFPHLSFGLLHASVKLVIVRRSEQLKTEQPEMQNKNKLIALAILVSSSLAVESAVAGPLGYTLDVTTFYQFGAPAGVLNGVSGSPDTGFFTVMNNGVTTFSGTIGALAVDGGGTDWSFTSGALALAPGASATFGINSESSNVGGFNGPTGSPQPGVQILINGLINGSEVVGLSVFDADIHSGVPVPSPASGLLTDSYVLQGGDPLGFDTGDTFEVAQAPGHFDGRSRRRTQSRRHRPAKGLPDLRTRTTSGAGHCFKSPAGLVPQKAVTNPDWHQSP